MFGIEHKGPDHQTQGGHIKAVVLVLLRAGGMIGLSIAAVARNEM